MKRYLPDAFGEGSNVKPGYLLNAMLWYFQIFFYQRLQCITFAG